MKPDPDVELSDNRAIGAMLATSGGARSRRSPIRLAAAAFRDAIGLVLATLFVMVAAAIAALLVVRVGADILQGIDPFATEARRPRLYPQQLVLREVASDILRQCLIVAIVIGAAIRSSGGAWRARLALTPVEAPGLAPSRLLAILLLWPFLHILWVIGTADVFHMAFGRNVGLSPLLSRTGAIAWLAFTIVLAPVAEEVLMRGAMFERASRFLNPWGAILSTSALFVLLHIQVGSIARPVSLIPLALMLGWLRWRTGRLWPCILLHVWSNLAVVAYLLWPAPA
ncbi:CPBP family intramembrane glutamic endopeptidase [Methylobacterium sp. 88A]|uniref:CPBP family intramembrane glutamic endopeptidase n=1 Tax=Methylobacterium sp. 88A TaxID=1131813 RepID=UPI0003A08575|nr:CPBP family intramembrane glutamic endopeptidase [Methylobacterium sp. 88A]